jgi:CheY-like chemotaxis protein
VASRAKSAFLATMSHELRTPLNAILGYAQILRRGADLNDRQASGLHTIQESGEHLLTLINDILDLARIEAGRLELLPGALNLLVFLRIVADIIRVRAEQKSVLFVCALAPDLPPAVLVDERRLRQVLLNLLGNAVKFTDHGQVTLRVRSEEAGTGAARNFSHLTFEVEDTGIGMTEQQKARLFQPFEQLAEVRRREGGAGLGLAISRQLVQLMGGEIQVMSEPGKGSRFWFSLQLPILDAEIAVPSAAPVVTGYEGMPKKVLVVDDVVANRAVLADALEALGFEIHEAENGRDGLTRAESLNPDLIVMDVMMPVMDGLEAIRRLRQMAALKDAPVIAVSATTSPEDRDRALAAGANAFLTKPIDLDGLLKEIGGLLGLTWIYRAVDDNMTTAVTPSVPLVPPPPEEMRILYELALRGNMREIREYTEHLLSLGETYCPFAEKLRQMTDQFRSKAILAMIKQHLNRETSL